MQNLLLSIGAGWIRHAITGLAVWLAYKGYLNESQESEFVGAVMVLGALGWSAVHKKSVAPAVPAPAIPAPPVFRAGSKTTAQLNAEERARDGG